MAAEWDNIHGYKLSTFSQKYASPAKKKKILLLILFNRTHSIFLHDNSEEAFLSLILLEAGLKAK